MRTNFDFLERYWPALSQIGSTAESYLYDMCGMHKALAKKAKNSHMKSSRHY